VAEGKKEGEGEDEEKTYARVEKGSESEQPVPTMVERE